MTEQTKALVEDLTERWPLGREQARMLVEDCPQNLLWLLPQLLQGFLEQARRELELAPKDEVFIAQGRVRALRDTARSLQSIAETIDSARRT